VSLLALFLKILFCIVISYCAHHTIDRVFFIISFS